MKRLFFGHDQENLKFQSRKDGFKLFNVVLAIPDFITISRGGKSY